MNIRWRVELRQDEREELTALLKSGRHAVRKVKRAQILLAADDGVGDGEVAARVGAGGSTVYRTKRRFVEGNLELALAEAPRPGAQRKLSGKEEALLIATACSAPPAGRARWTLELLADVMVALTEHEGLSRETVRRRLAENALKPWRRDMWCVPKVDAAYVAAMEDVLDLYGEPPDPTRPVICFDESPTQLIGEVRAPIPAEPGRLERFDFEYKRNGTVNLFIFLDVNRPWRKVKVTERRAAADFSQCMRELSDVHFPEAEKIRVVMDNLSTHSPASLYNALPAPEARRILRRLEFHFTPKHASWLNMVEIEIGVLRGQCLDRRISSRDILEAEIAVGRPGKGNDKGKVEGIVGYCRRNFLVPMPRFRNFDDFNTHLEACCAKRWAEQLRGHDQTVGERLERDRAVLQRLPAIAYDACDKRPGRVSSLSLVRYRGTDYSVPTRFGHC